MTSKSGTAPEILPLPTGGGAVSGIGSTFSPDLHTGTGNLSVPLSLPPGRGGIQPALSLVYSTGQGNSPFGLGWGLDVPGVTRNSSRGVPVYDDDVDTFLLSGAEDLVYVGDTTFDGDTYREYRPRTEGLFAKILYRANVVHPYWVVRSKSGLTSFYGTPNEEGGAWVDPATCVDPSSDSASPKIFAWKLSRTVDTFGNAIEYIYSRDSDDTGDHHWDQLYLAEVRWCEYGAGPSFLAHVYLDYEDRPDPFSTYRQGFEVRTTKRCTQIEVCTQLDEADDDRVDQQKVRTYELTYDDAAKNGVGLLTQVLVRGHKGESSRTLPPLEFSYTGYSPEDRRFERIEGSHLPDTTLDDPTLETVDLFGNGLPDLVQMDGYSFRYWRNRGDGVFDRPRFLHEGPAELSLADPRVQFMDCDGDGRPDLFVHDTAFSGYFPMRFGATFDKRSFQAYDKTPPFGALDPEIRYIDLDGDGHVDALRTGESFQCFFQSTEKPDGSIRVPGWTRTRVVKRKHKSEFPDVSFSDPRIRLADMTGDGLTDIVFFYKNAVHYWPNLGHGDFGPRVVMTGLDLPDRYDPARVFLADIDGDGCADVVFVDHCKVDIYVNQSGNDFAEPITVRGTPGASDLDAVRIMDLYGHGVPGVLWHLPPVSSGGPRMYYLDVTGGTKPYLLDTVDNHMGSLTTVSYRSSTVDYVRDDLAGNTWETPLPFPVLVVGNTTSIDQISGSKLTTEYSYHHGYWDGRDREFRGFGRVDARDTEVFEDYNAGSGFETVPEASFSPPRETRTWFHQGAVGDPYGEVGELDYDPEYSTHDTNLFTGLLAALPEDYLDRRMALRTLRGSILRTELYALDGSALEDRPYTVTEAVFGSKKVDEAHPNSPNGWPIFFPHALASRTTEWDRGEEPMTAFSFSCTFDGTELSGDDAYDEYGMPLLQTSIAVPRGRNPLDGTGSSEPYLCTHTLTTYAVPDDIDAAYIVDRACNVVTYEVPNDGGLTDPSVFDLKQAIDDDSAPGEVIGHVLHYYDGDAYVGEELGVVADHGVLSRTETLAMTDETLSAAYPGVLPFVRDSAVDTDASAETWSFELSALEKAEGDLLVIVMRVSGDDGAAEPLSTPTGWTKHVDKLTGEQRTGVFTRVSNGTETSADLSTENAYLGCAVCLSIGATDGSFYASSIFTYDYPILEPAPGPQNYLWLAARGYGLDDSIGIEVDSDDLPSQYAVGFTTAHRMQTTPSTEFVTVGVGGFQDFDHRKDHAFYGTPSNQPVSIMMAVGQAEEVAQPNVGHPHWLTEDSPSWKTEYPTAFRTNVSQRGGYVLHESVIEVTDGYYVISAANEYSELGLLTETRDPLAAYEGRDGTRVIYDDYDLLVASVTDALDLLTTASHDYRGFQPIAVQDPNENHTQFSFDELGFLTEVAVLGKYDDVAETWEGDDPEFASIVYSYFLTDWDDEGQPTSVWTSRRCFHFNDPDFEDQWIDTVEYSDGFGRLVQTRTVAEGFVYGDSESVHPYGSSGLSPDMTVASTDAVPYVDILGKGFTSNVVVSGWTVYDNKGNVVEKYEPFFDSFWNFTDKDNQPEGLKSVLMRYDARGRNVETTYPDGSQERVVFGIPTALDDPDDFESTPWESYAYGRNDLGALTHDPGETWSYADHYWTPASMTVDALGRVVSSIARNHQSDTDEWFETKTSYDIRGNVLTVTDPLDRVAATQVYDLLNRSLRTESIDAGDSIIVYDAASLPRETRDGKGALILSGYDDGLRQTHLWARDDDTLDMGLRIHTIYGDDAGLSTPEDDNLNGKPHLQYDEAGRLTFASYDFKGNLLHKERTVIDPQLLVTAAGSGNSGNGWTYTPHRTDWDAGETLSQRESALLDSTDYETSTAYDALNRPKWIQLPEDQENDRRIIRPTYNAAGALQSVDVEDDGPTTTTYVDRIAYNARGQRLFVALGNGVMTRYAYDPNTFRLARMRSAEYSESLGTYTEDGAKFQDNGYHYDLAGNILSIFDKSDPGVTSSMPGSIAGYPYGVPQSSTFWRQYSYDPLSRLLTANGVQDEVRWDGPPDGMSIQDPSAWWAREPEVVEEYNESYSYDANSNLLSLSHANTVNFTRDFTIDSGSNRLEEMSIGMTDHTYLYDAVGNMVKENTNRQMTWDFADRMHTYRTQVDAQPASVFAHYLYDAGGERVMKVVSKASSDVVTIYIDGVFEHRELLESADDDINDEIHIMDGAERVARLRVGEKFGDDSSPDVIYVLSDHLGSSTFTLEHDGSFFSREEYTPYGESAFGAYDKKRYRFTAKEKDEESGLHYHSARYYAPWLGRWTSSDPAGFVNGPNVYAHVRGNPIARIDPTGTEDAPPTIDTGIAPQRDRGATVPDSEYLSNWYKTEAGTLDVPTPEILGLGDNSVFEPVFTEIEGSYHLVAYKEMSESGEFTRIYNLHRELTATLGSDAGLVPSAVQPDDLMGLGLGSLAKRAASGVASKVGRSTNTVAGGAGGSWRTIGERVDPSVVKQADPMLCGGAACEMLLESQGVNATQHEVAKKAGRLTTHGGAMEPRALADAMNDISGSSSWRGGGVYMPNATKRQHAEALSEGGEWAPLLHADTRVVGHFVVVEGMDDAGRLAIKDSADQTRYFMDFDEFASYWHYQAVFKLP